MQRLQTLFLLTASLSLAASQPLGQGRQVDPTEAKLAAQAEAPGRAAYESTVLAHEVLPRQFVGAAGQPTQQRCPG